MNPPRYRCATLLLSHAASFWSSNRSGRAAFKCRRRAFGIVSSRFHLEMACGEHSKNSAARVTPPRSLTSLFIFKPSFMPQFNYS